MEVYLECAHGEEAVAAVPVEELVRFVAAAEGVPENAEVSVRFVDDSEMAELNEQFRGKSGPTDVLSFECDGLDDGFDDAFAAFEGEASELDIPFELGDIVIAPDVAQRQTELFGTTFASEISLLLVHGMLHLCGYDHIEDDEAEAMEARERALLGLWADAGHEEVRHVRDDTIRVRGEH